VISTDEKFSILIAPIDVPLHTLYSYEENAGYDHIFTRF
jgi:hypothetical protein